MKSSHSLAQSYPWHLYGLQTRQYWQKVRQIRPANFVGYWPLWDLSGSQATDISPQLNHGAYTGVDLGQAGIGDGRTCPLYDGVNDWTLLNAAGLPADFNGAEGTLSLFFKVYNAGVWSDGANRYMFNIETDGLGANWIFLRKTTTANNMFFRYIAGGTTKSVSVTLSPAAWTHAAMSWSKAAEQMKAYLNGAQTGSTQTTLGAWSGSPHPNRTCIGSYSDGPVNPWYGWLAHCALWNAPLDAWEIARLAKVP